LRVTFEDESMKTFQFMLAVILVAGLSGCASPSPSAVGGRYSYSTAVDYSVLKSFVLLPVEGGTFSTPESTAHFRKVMVSGLSAKGFTENPTNPDFVIKTIPVASYREEYVSIHGGLLAFPKAMLRVTFVNPSSGVHIYEGAADAHFDAAWSQEDKNGIIDAAVEVILKGFPPSKK
jgi:hypothetical protein